MYLIYINESGDCGLPRDGSPTSHFILSGLVVHELRWSETLERLIQFRRMLSKTHRVGMAEELHAAALITRGKSKLGKGLEKLPKHQRLAVLRMFVNEIAQLPDVSIINVVVDKRARSTKEEVFEIAWKAILQRFENTLRYRNFPGPANPDERGVVFADNTDGEKLRKFLRTMRRFNPVPSRHSFGSRNIPVEAIIEDPNLKDSRLSYFIQVVDCVAYVLKQFIQPNAYMKAKGGHAYFHRLQPVLCTVASSRDPMGVVYV